MTWNDEYRQITRVHLGLAISAMIFQLLFLIQVILNRSLRELSMFWVYNYLLTDFLILIQTFMEYILRTTLPYCISHTLFYILCNLEAYITSYMTVLEAYILVCLNFTRYYMIVKNCNISREHPRLLIGVTICLYTFSIAIFVFQVEIFQIVTLHPHQQSQNCHFQYHDIKTQIGNLILVLLIPTILNLYFMTLTAIHVRQSRRTVRMQANKHVHLLVQSFIVYILWLGLWSPNVIVTYVFWNRYLGAITRFGNLTNTLCDPVIFMFIDRRFLKVWKQTLYKIVRSSRRIQPTTTSNEPNISTVVVK